MKNNKIDSYIDSNDPENVFPGSNPNLENIKQTPFKYSKNDSNNEYKGAGELNKKVQVLYIKEKGCNTNEVPLDKKEFSMTKASVTNLISLAFEIDPDCIVAHFQNGEDCEPYLQKILRLKPFTKVIIISEDPSLYKAVRIIEAGAFDYIISPVDKEELSNIIKQASKQKNLESGYSRRQSKLNSA
ncbi:MAG: hypothetical protein ACQESP_12535 [Candidatus Muiribacteriota bacterium]